MCPRRSFGASSGNFRRATGGDVPWMAPGAVFPAQAPGGVPPGCRTVMFRGRPLKPPWGAFLGASARRGWPERRRSRVAAIAGDPGGAVDSRNSCPRGVLPDASAGCGWPEPTPRARPGAVLRRKHRVGLPGERSRGGQLRDGHVQGTSPEVSRGAFLGASGRVAAIAGAVFPCIHRVGGVPRRAELWCGNCRTGLFRGRPLDRPGRCLPGASTGWGGAAIAGERRSGDVP